MNSVTYVLFSKNVSYCILIDCGEYERLRPILDKIGKKVKAVLLTHGHSDHIYGLLKLLKDQKEVEVYASELGHEEVQDSRKNMSFYQGCPFIIDGYKSNIVHDGDVMHFKGLADIQVMETPGHSPSCISYIIGNNIFTGDAYIPGLKVFAKFPRSNKSQALESMEKLMQMEQKGYIVHCGHHDYKDL